MASPATTTDPIEAARQRRAKAAEDAAKLKADIEAKQQAIRDLAEQERQADAEEKAAEDAARIAEREKAMFGKLTAEQIQWIVRDLQELFADARARKDGMGPREFWAGLDAIRCRLHTNEIPAESMPIVLAMEHLIGACDRWEIAHAAGGTPDEMVHGSIPVDDHRIQTAEGELQREIDGLPPAKMESFFMLFNANVSPQQMAKMLGITKANGVGDLKALAQFFDRMAKRAGVDPSRSLAVKRYAALDEADAIEMRRQRIDSQVGDALVPGSPDMGDGRHAGRFIRGPRKDA